MDFTTSEDTEQLCDNTIDMMKSFQRMLQANNARRRPELPCPCGRSQHSGGKQPENQEQQRQEPQKPLEQQQPIICSNVSNLISNSQQGRVLTSPSEIRLLLRLESWLGDNGVLMVKPSVHRESSADPCQATAGNNNTAARPAPPATSDTAEEGVGDFDEVPDDAAADTERELLQLSRRQHRLASARNSTVAGSKPRQQQHQQQNQHQQQHQQVHRRERLLVRRPASVVAGTASAKAGSSGARAARREAELSRGETMSLIRKLHGLLSEEMKRSSAGAE